MMRHRICENKNWK